MSGSNWVPEQRRISAIASATGSAFLNARVEVMASKASAIAMMRDANGMLLSGKPRGVPFPVEPFVVVQDSGKQGAEEVDRFESLDRVLRVTDDLRELLVRKSSGLVQDRVPDADHPEVVQHRRPAKVFQLLPRQPQFLRDGHGEERRTLRVAADVGILQLKHLKHRINRSDHSQNCPPELPRRLWVLILP